VLYRLPQLIEDIALGRRIYFTEGEKDADTLVSHGLSATAHANGVDGWREEFAACFTDADTVILPDNDRPGRDYARRVANAIQPFARSVRVLMLPDLPKKGSDVTDWFEMGGTVEELTRMVNETAPWRLRDRIRPPTKTQRAAWFLQAELANGPRSAKGMLQLARQHGISERTVRYVVGELGIKPAALRENDGRVSEWVWSLPQDERIHPPPVETSPVAA
jgi:DNA primase